MQEGCTAIKRDKPIDKMVGQCQPARTFRLVQQSGTAPSALFTARVTEQISKGYRFSTDTKKCVAIAMKNDGCIHFGDGTRSGKEFEAMYFGNKINRTVNIKHEVFNKSRCQKNLV